ncbi:long-chain-fatty-acid--CoA ligase [Saccharopolyspora dendranthemae]|uniref:Acyl-CoA synthetase (AMP-forming)/AMP-acid ligase II n=1 Tax=Saccharopolyspora dendranthemae TaxID=1181886 RepID=A0A561U8D3_9PSEU|nr:long-chain-fatty-acid--CoA ligase [Saccharopolyspora dendranthemae]TWF95613.1 acyl-CoA synthetase (AMP-forming)/AMP-acid ligase II [Saccharopolyspora dendranthemae]
MVAEDSRIYDFIARWAAEKPDEEAIAFGERRVTWAQLDDRVRRAAGALRASGVGPGERFAVVDKNHLACLELTLAASLIGAVNTVVNFRLAAEELVHVLNDSTARVVVVGSEFAGIVDEVRDRLPHLREVILLGGEDDEYEERLAAADAVTEARESDPDECFLQLYTSGTTGWPKGAMLTQRSMMAHTRALTPAYRMDADSINVVAMPLFHVGGTSWALGGLSAGARTVLVREIVPGPLLDLIENTRATHAFFVPAVIHALLEEGERARTATASLDVLGYGGSPMPAPLMERVLRSVPTPLYSVYGMTEMSGVFCVLGPEEHRDEQRTHLRASAGRPLPGNEVRVVEPATGDDVERGELGEFWVRSQQRMSGYWNLPEATAETITPDGWLRTGDAGREDDDGYLYIEDRVKDMIITGGENVYPAEVERVVLEFPGVAEVAVIGAPDEKWGEAVTAYVVCEQGESVDDQALLDFTRSRLAHYKCPKSVSTVAALPRNATGKILKRLLRSG